MSVFAALSRTSASFVKRKSLFLLNHSALGIQTPETPTILPAPCCKTCSKVVLPSALQQNGFKPDTLSIKACRTLTFRVGRSGLQARRSSLAVEATWIHPQKAVGEDSLSCHSSALTSRSALPASLALQLSCFSAASRRQYSHPECLSQDIPIR